MFGMHAAWGTLRTNERVLSLFRNHNSTGQEQTKHEQVYHALRETIRVLGPGYSLPTAGKLASMIGVSRGTVHAVYEHLAADGCLKLVRHWGAVTNNVEGWTCPTNPTTQSGKSSSSAEAQPAG